MDVNDVEKLIDLMEKRGLTEIEIEDKDGKVRLKKQGEVTKEIISFPQGGVPVPVEHNTAGTPTPEKKDETGSQICAPVVGTFFRRADPETDPFVKIGDHVEDDTVVCIIEAMKILNEVKAETAGVISEILIEDGHPVEYMQPMFRVEPVDSPK